MAKTVSFTVTFSDNPATEGIGSCGPVFFHYATGVDLEFTLRAADVVEKQAGRVKWAIKSEAQLR